MLFAVSLNQWNCRIHKENAYQLHFLTLLAIIYTNQSYNYISIRFHNIEIVNFLSFLDSLFVVLNVEKKFYRKHTYSFVWVYFTRIWNWVEKLFVSSKWIISKIGKYLMFENEWNKLFSHLNIFYRVNQNRIYSSSEWW